MPAAEADMINNIHYRPFLSAEKDSGCIQKCAQQPKSCDSNNKDEEITNIASILLTQSRNHDVGEIIQTYFHIN